MRGVLRHALRSLCLPYRAPLEASAARALARFLRANGIAYEDCANWVSLQLGGWSDGGQPQNSLVDAVDFVLIATAEDHQILSGSGYFAAYHTLVNAHEYSHAAAIALLSHMRTAYDLCTRYRLSAGRLAYILSGLDQRYTFSRSSITAILAQCDIEVQLAKRDLQALCERDQSDSILFFADSDLGVGASLLGGLADSLGALGNIFADLSRLAPEPNSTEFIAQIQMLHYQCAICEFFDNSEMDLYEFNPRGSAANWLFDSYPANLVSARNPFLNNAKSVLRIDANWAESKKSAVRPGALALFRVLRVLDAMSHAQRRELAGRIRQWIYLFMRLSANEEYHLPANLDLKSRAAVISFISLANTGSAGILEQRLLDCFAFLDHQGVAWSARGLRDSVNATNVSRRKLGDCDFQNTAEKKIVAYEAHGGSLTETYLLGHVRTLHKIIPLRKVELETVAPIEEWSLEVFFVAHSLLVPEITNLTIDGLRVVIRATTFIDQCAAHYEHPNLGLSFDSNFLAPLNERRTPNYVRQKVTTMY